MNFKDAASHAPPPKRAEKWVRVPDLSFQVESVEVARAAAVPTLLFRLRIRQRAGIAMAVPVRNVSLHCQLRIDATNREYDADQKSRLAELFGERENPRRTLGTLLWARAHADVGPFQAVTTVDLAVPCSYDFNLAATKYFNGMETGAVPLLLLFSGSVVYRGPDGQLAIDQIPWSAEARYELPVQVWRDLMQRYYPNQIFVGVERSVYYALNEYRRQNGCDGFGEAIESLLRRPASVSRSSTG